LVWRIFCTVWPSLKKAIVWAKGTRLSLPVESCGTLILQEGDRLGESDQADLLRWLSDSGRSVQVLTTSPRPLLPLVEAGSFLDSLYYRLNQVLIAVD
jgi:transcriptional regulator of acetoin/glycerol metabolism